MSRETYLEALRKYIKTNRDVTSTLNGISCHMETDRRAELGSCLVV